MGSLQDEGASEEPGIQAGAVDLLQLVPACFLALLLVVAEVAASCWARLREVRWPSEGKGTTSVFKLFKGARDMEQACSDV